MLVRVDIESENAFYVPILGVTPKDSLLIKKITGLGPPDPSLFIGDYARDGGSYQGRRVGKRNPVITMELNPNPALGETVSGMREMLYKTFLDPTVDADYVKMVLREDDGRVRYLVGYTEKFEVDLFDQENLAQISLICPDPYIRDNVETVLTHPTGWISVPFTYGGTAETGFDAEIIINANTPKLTLENNGRTMQLTRDFVVGERVLIRTIRGSRRISLIPTGIAEWNPVTSYVHATPGGTVLYQGMVYKAHARSTGIEPTNTLYWTPNPELITSLIAYLSPISPWLELHSQANTMSVYGSAPTNFVAGIKSLKFTQAYWGI